MRHFSIALLLALALVPSASFAQLPDFGPPPAQPLPEIPEGLVSCFDHYTFGSVDVTLEGNTSTVAAGTDLTLTGTIVNKNDYAVSNLKVYAKLFDAPGAEKSSIGPDVIDDFLVVDTGAFGQTYAENGFTLRAGESRTFNLSYPLPPTLIDGQYQMALYVVASDRFNMSGLSFTDDVVASLHPFTVIGGGSGSAYFDRTSFSVEGRPHFFVAYPSTVLRGEKSATIAGVLKNDTDINISGTLTWTLYKWDSRKGDAALDTVSVPVSVPANSSVSVAYELTNTLYPVYQLVGKFDTARGPSVIGVRLVREGVDEPRINFVGIDATESGPVAFACVHNTGSAERIDDTTVSLTVETEGVFKRTLVEKTYTGAVSGSMAALIAPFSFVFPESSVMVTTAVERGGVVIDSVTSTYTCEELGVCSLVSLELLILIVALGALILVGALIALFRPKRPPPISYSTIPPL